MADLPENDELELTEDLEVDEAEDQEEQEESEQEDDAGEPEEQPSDEPDEDELIIEGEDSPSSSDDSELVKQLRARIAEQNKLLKQGNKPPEVGPKPKAEDFNYDDDAYEAALLKWHEDKAKADQAQASQQDQVEQFRAEVEEHRGEYQRQQSQLKVPGFEIAEARVLETLDEGQQTALLLAAKNKAAVVAALGKYPKRLEALAGIKNPISLAVAVAELERNLKVQPRRKGPEPEEKQRGTAPISTSAKEREIARLEAKIGRGGDVTADLKRLRELRAKG